jgi:hypothetical protein
MVATFSVKLLLDFVLTVKNILFRARIEFYTKKIN